jgi:hypothetical protein
VNENEAVKLRELTVSTIFHMAMYTNMHYEKKLISNIKFDLSIRKLVFLNVVGLVYKMICLTIINGY